jgi:anion-transporting  ArsA/GET3 family ATPase
MLRSRGPAAVSILDRRLVFVTGKGGVGKTSVAAALAELAARRGAVLVCEMDAKGALAGAFDALPLSFEPRRLEPTCGRWR